MESPSRYLLQKLNSIPLFNNATSKQCESVTTIKADKNKGMHYDYFLANLVQYSEMFAMYQIHIYGCAF